MRPEKTNAPSPRRWQRQPAHFSAQRRSQPVDAQEEPKWDFNTSLLYYGEDDDRVQDPSFKSIIRRLFADDRLLTLGLTVDALTGATPSGAIRQDVARILHAPVRQ